MKTNILRIFFFFNNNNKTKEKLITTNKKPPPKNHNTSNNTEAHFDNLQVHIWSEYIVEWLSVYLAKVQVSLLQGEDVCPKYEGDSLYESKSLTGYFKKGKKMMFCDKKWLSRLQCIM